MVKWTLRRSGALRTTIIIKYHVSQDAVGWLRGQAAITERQALAFIRRHAHELTGLHVLGIDAQGEPCVVHTDDVVSVALADEGFVFYVGHEDAVV